jgi:hypothetical protein
VDRTPRTVENSRSSPPPGSFRLMGWLPTVAQATAMPNPNPYKHQRNEPPESRPRTTRPRGEEVTNPPHATRRGSKSSWNAKRSTCVRVACSRHPGVGTRRRRFRAFYPDFGEENGSKDARMLHLVVYVRARTSSAPRPRRQRYIRSIRPKIGGCEAGKIQAPVTTSCRERVAEGRDRAG